MKRFSPVLTGPILLFLGAVGAGCSASDGALESPLDQQSSALSGRSVMVIAPHEDDETIACSGVIERAVSRGDDVTLVMVTNGDYADGNYPEKARTRITHTINSMSVLGLSQSHIVYLSYPDASALWFAYHDPSLVCVSTAAGNPNPEKTYGFAAPDPLNLPDYHFAKYGVHADCNRTNILGDLREVINERRPQEIYLPAVMESHPDHSATALFANEAILAIKRTASYSPVLHEYMIYKGDMPQNNLVVEPVAKPADMDQTPYDWTQREAMQVPSDMLAPIDSGQNRKDLAYDEYGWEADGYRNFIKSDEVFWKKDMSNLALGAIEVTASSETPESSQYARNVINGQAIGFPFAVWSFLTEEWLPLHDQEWATRAELGGAWIRLRWATPITANRMILHDRPNDVDHISRATLSFSDGSTVPVASLPNNGVGQPIFFPTKTFSWVKLTIDQAEGANVGLSEWEIFNVPGSVVLGFERGGDWTANNATVSTVSYPVTQGQAALAVTGATYTELTSPRLTSAEAAVAGHLVYDVFIPTEQPNPYWIGQTQAFLSAPSRAVNNASLGTVNLTGLSLGEYHTVSLTVPYAVLTALRGASFDDLTIKLVLNVNAGSGAYVLDKLRFTP